MNTDIQTAWEFVEHTGRSIFLTGKAGTGKTTFLRRIVEKSKKRLVVVAPTGVAAINAGGVTIHSFFQLPLSPFVPGMQTNTKYEYGREKRKIIASLDLLIIDEISMVRSDLLDAIDAVLRRFRDRSKPFGGVQLLMIGDLGQLTPVVTPEDEALLRSHYTTPYFFGSKALAQTDYVTILLNTVYRQQDSTFVNILNRIREGQPTEEDIALLNSRCDPSFRPRSGSGYIRLTTHNRMADSYNESQLEALDTPSFSYEAKIEGTFPEYSYPTPLSLTLKVGSQVMFIKNDPSEEHLYYNGKIGEVTYLDKETIQVACLGDEEDITVTRQAWENNKYTINAENNEIETEVLGTFTQFPLRLAWAITIHKSQGLTFDKAVIDAGSSFAPGQVYVALSRCRSIDGIVLATKLSQSAVIRDYSVNEYIDYQDARAQQSISQLPMLKEEYNRMLLMELFDFRNLLDTEASMTRLMTTYFTNSFPLLTSDHRKAMEGLDIKVRIVADKWRALIMSMDVQQLHDEKFLERVKRSAEYFAKTIHECLDRPVRLSTSINTTNKEAKRRLTYAYADLKNAYISRKILLKAIAEKGFSTETYLREKNSAIMFALNDAEEKTEKKTSKKTKAKKETKAPKEKTWEVSYKLFKQGKTPVMIAVERQLTPQTVYGHLARYIDSGELKLADIIATEKIKTVRRAIKMIGDNATTSEIKAACPPEITYSDIILVTKYGAE